MRALLRFPRASRASSRSASRWTPTTASARPGRPPEGRPTPWSVDDPAESVEGDRALCGGHAGTRSIWQKRAENPCGAGPPGHRTLLTRFLREERDQVGDDDPYGGRPACWEGRRGGPVTGPPGSQEPTGSTGNVTRTRSLARATGLPGVIATGRALIAHTYEGPSSVSARAARRGGRCIFQSRRMAESRMLSVPTARSRRTMTDDAAALLAAYDAQLRGVAEVQGSQSWDRYGPLWRAVSRPRGFVSYESLEGVGDVDALIAATVEHFAG